MGLRLAAGRLGAGAFSAGDLRVPALFAAVFFAAPLRAPALFRAAFFFAPAFRAPPVPRLTAILRVAFARELLFFALARLAFFLPRGGITPPSRAGLAHASVAVFRYHLAASSGLYIPSRAR